MWEFQNLWTNLFERLADFYSIKRWLDSIKHFFIWNLLRQIRSRAFDSIKWWILLSEILLSGMQSKVHECMAIEENKWHNKMCRKWHADKYLCSPDILKFKSCKTFPVICIFSEFHFWTFINRRQWFYSILTKGKTPVGSMDLWRR